MTQYSRHPDISAHEPGCRGTDVPEIADLCSLYSDVFCDCHCYTEPKILMNGADIAWPAGWSLQQARDWRQRKGLVLPMIQV